MDVTSIVQFALAHEPIFQERVKKDGFLDWFTDMIGYAERKISRDSGIDDFHVKLVWIGAQRFSFCWALSDRFLKPNRTELEDEQLKKFKELANVCMDEPKSYADIEGPEPTLLARLKSIPRNAYPMTAVDCDARFLTGEYTVELLVEDYRKHHPNYVEDIEE